MVSSKRPFNLLRSLEICAKNENRLMASNGSWIANVQKEPTKLKNEKNESHSLYDLICLAECWVETEYATMSGQLVFAFVAFCKEAIREQRRNSDYSKFMRGGADNTSETKGAGVEVMS